MVYKIEFKESAKKSFAKLEKNVQKRIFEFLDKKVRHDPTIYREPLHGDKKGLWKYRIGDYRIVCQINNKQLLVLVVAIGHRREIYK